MGGGGHRYIFLCNVYADAEAFLVYVREVLLGFFGVFVGDVQIHMVFTALFHFVVDGTCHDVTRGQRESRVILLHEFLSVFGAQHAAITAHGFGDEERGAVSRVEKGCRMELDEFHVLHCSLGTVYHGNAVSRGHQRIGGVAVNGFATARCHDGDFGKEGVHLARRFVQHVGTVALDAGSVAGYDDSLMMLGDDFHGVVVGQYGDVGMLLYGFNEACLYFCARIVLMVEDTEFGVAAFLVQVKFSVLLLVEVHSPFDKLLDLSGGIAHHLLYGFTVADPVTRNHSIFYMLFKVVYGQIGDRGDTSLCKISVCLFQTCLADEGYCSFMRYLQRKTHTGKSGADNEKIELSYHRFCVLKRSQR